MAMAAESRHISVDIDRCADAVYAYAADPTHLPEWAPGLCTAIKQVDGRWVADSGMGRIVIDFASPNPFGILDHDVTTSTGQTFHNPIRILPNGDRAEIVFTLRRQAGVTDAEFDRDAAAVHADLTALKQIMESAGAVPRPPAAG
jgi:uncharacterized protein YndB with AHSA1/START domain